MRLNRTHKRPLEISRGPADRDPMFEPIWYDGSDTLEERRRKGLPDYPKPPLGPRGGLAPLSPLTEPEQVPGPRWDFAPLPPPSDLQQNDHVMRYWNWRLDRLEGKRNG